MFQVLDHQTLSPGTAPLHYRPATWMRCLQLWWCSSWLYFPAFLHFHEEKVNDVKEPWKACAAHLKGLAACFYMPLPFWLFQQKKKLCMSFSSCTSRPHYVSSVHTWPYSLWWRFHERTVGADPHFLGILKTYIMHNTSQWWSFIETGNVLIPLLHLCDVPEGEENESQQWCMCVCVLRRREKQRDK